MKFILLAVMSLTTLAAHASGLDAIFQGINSGSKLCFERSYQGPLPSQQRVRSIKAVLGRTGGSYVTPYLAIEVSLKDRPGVSFTQYMSCMEVDGGVYCPVDCDGGGMTILGRGTVLRLRNEGVSLYSCGGEDIDENGEPTNPVERIWLNNLPGGDDRFNLKPAPLANCAEVETYD